MSDNAIRVGDLVCVVKPTPCCGADESVGRIFEVVGFAGTYHCKHCGKIGSEQCAMVDERWRYRISRLCRIDPLWELDEAERKIEEPA